MTIAVVPEQSEICLVSTVGLCSPTLAYSIMDAPVVQQRQASTLRFKSAQIHHGVYEAIFRVYYAIQFPCGLDPVQGTNTHIYSKIKVT